MSRLIRMVALAALSLTALAVLGINTTAAHAQGTGGPVDLLQTATYTAPAHAQGTGKPESGPRPDIPPAYCLGATQNAKVTGTNTWSQYGNVTNNCFTTAYNGFVELTANLTCGGSVPTEPSDTIISQIPGRMASSTGILQVRRRSARCAKMVSRSAFHPFMRSWKCWWLGMMDLRIIRN